MPNFGVTPFCYSNYLGYHNLAFPSSIQQRCIVHLIRNSCKYLSYNDRKEFCNGLKKVYRAINEATALSNLDECEEKWKDKYPYANWGVIYSSLQILFEGRL